MGNMSWSYIGLSLVVFSTIIYGLQVTSSLTFGSFFDFAYFFGGLVGGALVGVGQIHLPWYWAGGVGAICGFVFFILGSLLIDYLVRES